MKRKSKQDVTDQMAPASCNLHPTTQPSHSSAAQGAFTGKERGHTASATLRPCERPVQNLSPFDFSPTSNLFRLPLHVLLILSLSIASSIFISTSLRWFHTSNTIIVARRRCPDLQHSKVLQWHHPWMILCVCKSLDMHASINTHRQLGMAHCMVHHVDPFTVPLAGWASLAHSSKAH